MFKFLKKIFSKQPQYGTGWLGDEKEYLDERNFHSEEIFKTYPTPEWKEKQIGEWRKFEPIRNQFSSNACVAFSLALALGVENYLEENRFELLSSRFIYSRGFVPPDGGMYYLQALEIARKEGTCLEQQMPSDMKDESSMRIKDDTPNARWVAQIYKANSYVFLPLDIDIVAGILQSTKKVVLLGTRFNSGGFSKAEVVLDKYGRFGHAVCFHPNTMILTKSGYKPIKDIQAGEEVLTHKGRFRKVLKTMRRMYNGEMIKLQTTKSIQPALMTPEHPVLARHIYYFQNITYQLKQGINKFEFIPASELKKESVLVNGIMPIEDTKITPELAFLLGAYIGDGNLKKPDGGKKDKFYTLRFSLSSTTKQDLLNKIIEITRKNFGLNPHFYFPKGEKCVQVIFHSRELCKFIEKYAGIPKNKFIHPEILNAPLPVVKAFLEGLVATDGSYLKKEKLIATSEKNIAYGIKILLEKCNYAYNIHYRKPHLTKINGKMHQTKGLWTFRFFENYTQSTAHYINNLCFIRVKNLEKTNYNGWVYNLEVEEDNTYIAEGFVVHNCAVDATLYKGKKAIIFQNSWGKDWGIGGLGIITEEQFKNGVVLCAYLIDFKYQPQTANKPHLYLNTNSLKVGDRGTEVLKLQVGLQWLGFFPAEQECTGYYGGITRQAVRDFRKSYNLPVLDNMDITAIKKFNEIFGS